MKHGMAKTRIYQIYHGIKQRCYNTNNPAYYLYGQKGIRMCKKWLNNFNAFYEWAIENGYNDKLSIDRIDSKKDYCPANCRWITLSENSKHVYDNPKRVEENQKKWIEWKNNKK